MCLPGLDDVKPLAMAGGWGALGGVLTENGGSWLQIRRPSAANLSSREASSLAKVTAGLVVAVGPEVVTGSGWDMVHKCNEGFS